MSRQQDRNYRGPIQVPVIPIETREKPVREVPKHRQCELCFGVLGGVGVAYGLAKKTPEFGKRYYKCKVCKHTWTYPVSPAQVLEELNESE